MDWKAFWNEGAQVREADFRRRVGRTFRSEPYSDRQLNAVLQTITAHLQPSPELSLLELACGNGLLTVRLAQLFERVTAVDFSARLINCEPAFQGGQHQLPARGCQRARGVQGPFDRVLMNAALQHLSPAQAERMIEADPQHLGVRAVRGSGVTTTLTRRSRRPCRSEGSSFQFGQQKTG